MKKLLLTVLFSLIITSCSAFLPKIKFDSQLHYAAHQGDVSIMKSALASGADINGKANFGWTPLHAAAASGNLDAVIFLIKHGAKIDARADRGWTARDEAFFLGHAEVYTFIDKVNAKQKTEHYSLITKFNTLVFSRRRDLMFSQWFDKYPLPYRFFWRNTLQTIDVYLQNTIPQYLAAVDYKNSVFNLSQSETSLLQSEFESNQAYANRQGDIEYQLQDRRKNNIETRLLLISDAVQWILKDFRLENPTYNQKLGVVEVDLISNNADFLERLQFSIHDPKLIRSFLFNVQNTSIDAYFNIYPNYYSLKNVDIYHSNHLFKALPKNVVTYYLSAF